MMLGTSVSGALNVSLCSCNTWRLGRRLAVTFCRSWIRVLLQAVAHSVQTHLQFALTCTIGRAISPRTPDNTHLTLNLSLHTAAQHAVQCKMVGWQQCPRYRTRDIPQPQN
jgi:hypothetical protein